MVYIAYLVHCLVYSECSGKVQYTFLEHYHIVCIYTVQPCFAVVKIALKMDHFPH